MARPTSVNEFDDWLDLDYGCITILDHRFMPSRILRELSPEAYAEEYKKYLDDIVDNQYK